MCFGCVVVGEFGGLFGVVFFCVIYNCVDCWEVGGEDVDVLVFGVVYCVMVFGIGGGGY